MTKPTMATVNIQTQVLDLLRLRWVKASITPPTARDQMPPHRTLPATTPASLCETAASKWSPNLKKITLSVIQLWQAFQIKLFGRSFIKKVYLILMAQLLVTLAFICLFIFADQIRDWVQTDGFWFYYVSYGTFLVTYIVLICIPSVRRDTPGNYICLAVFTLAFSYMVATISCYYTTNIVLIMIGITALVCLSISLFAIQTKIDFTMCSGLLFVVITNPVCVILLSRLTSPCAAACCLLSLLTLFV
ncbi:protein lifeguard 2-like isoform X2 [Haliotis rubra]|uniref:protein lifeguard 2-like isoform X2 n=1 Tax=Haliotis rubra TaxID=36100 RepID=UPI001EE5A86A|nr:protein lifeguard 2-like isoform X2 [Haliotis rubra]